MRPLDRIADRFEIERPVAAGGMGAVYACRDLATGERVAVKVMHEAEEASRFVREAGFLAQLTHPAIVRYVAHGITAEGRPFLAMEWLEGEDLAARLARGRLGVDEAVGLGVAVADALGWAHARGIVHRDVKPANLLLAAGDPRDPRLLDFGIARLRGHRSLTRTGAAIGSPGYMAPEQAQGALDLDERADVFSLGCVLYACLTGVPAFSGEHVAAVIGKLLAWDPPPVQRLAPGVSRALSGFVESMLAKDRDKRPAGAAAVAQALRELRPGAAIDPEGERDAPLHLGRRELRFVSIVLSRPRGAPAPAPTPDAPTLSAEEIVARRRLAAALAPFGAEARWSAEGTLVASVTGAPSAREQAALAARAALAVSAALPGAAVAVATGKGDTTVGLPTGEVFDRAARLLDEAATGEDLALLDEVTAGLLDARFDLVSTRAGGLGLRGERETLEPMRMLLGRATPCVGREREREALRALVADCLDGPAVSAVLVTAPAGIGKSRLVHELLLGERAARPALRTLFGRGDPISAGSPFAILARALRAHLGLFEGEPPAQAQRKLRARVAERLRAGEVELVSEFLGELVGAPSDDAPSVQLRAAREDRMVMGEQIRRAFSAFLAAEARSSPLLILLEDLHWGDAASVRCLDGALASLGEAPLLVLATARPEVHAAFPELWSARGLHEIRLGELPRRASRALVLSILGAGAPEEVVSRIVDRGGGSPFFLEELIRAEAEGRGDAPPETIVAMVQARLETLPPAARQVLRAASVLGETFWRGGVLALLRGGAREGEVDEHLAFLLERETIVRRLGSRFDGQPEYGFRHALVREAAYAMLVDEDRRLGHRLAAGWLEAVGERDALTMGEHLERGGEPQRAVAWYRAAAETAFQGSDLAGAIRAAERAIACGAEGEILGEALYLKAEAHFWRGEGAEAAREVEACVPRLTPGSAYWCQAMGGALVTRTQAGAFDSIAPLSQVLLEIEPGPAARTTYARGVQSNVLMFAAVGFPALSRGFLARLEHVAQLQGEADPITQAHLHLGRASAARCLDGDAAAALAEARASRACFAAAGGSPSVGFVDLEELLARAALGDPTLLAELEEIVSARPGATPFLPQLAALLALVLARADRREAALEAAARAAALLPDPGDQVFVAHARVLLAWAQLRAGDAAGAERAASAALAVVKGAPLRAAATALLALALRAGPRAAEAPPLARAALALARPFAAIGYEEPLLAEARALADAPA